MYRDGGNRGIGWADYGERAGGGNAQPQRQGGLTSGSGRQRTPEGRRQDHGCSGRHPASQYRYNRSGCVYCAPVDRRAPGKRHGQGHRPVGDAGFPFQVYGTNATTSHVPPLINGPPGSGGLYGEPLLTIPCTFSLGRHPPKHFHLYRLNRGALS